MLLRASAVLFVTANFGQPVLATELEVTHWWTSGGEAAAVAEFKKAFDATGDVWVDEEIYGNGVVARPIIVSRILGGDPMAATQLNHGRQAEELIKAGLIMDLTDVAEANNWRQVIRPTSLLDACTVDGRIYCAPVNIHSWQWLWLSNAAFAKAGVPVPKDWNEFVAAGPALRAAGLQPLALGQEAWQSAGAFAVLNLSIAGPELWLRVHKDRDMAAAQSPEMLKAFEAAVQARDMSRCNTVEAWNLATEMVIGGQAGGQIVGDWAQGEFTLVGQVSGKDFTCLPGLGVADVIQTGGDAFYFPIIEDPEITAAQKRLAALLVTPEVQVQFNLKKGSMPIRDDIDLNAASECMRKGLDILQTGAILPTIDQLLAPISVTELDDLIQEFWNSDTMTATEFQTRYAEVLARAE
ncbi:ABC transporter substrate-binding protein [Neogemmobacter tilapiae]|uniref:Probable sugar-binding periplasmic protein n=1 Tax=Neogemmobacter tilapiae TaxID=875041 RepID=A0A918WQ65_9RHOB|nr:ABC transporter substrate-binding protein [Gemmobacter tilapiae]GHC63640.1 ABC transporter substrate-binding protein [Gemmobacter tilapiae]